MAFPPHLWCFQGHRTAFLGGYHGGNKAIFMRFQGNITIFDRQTTTVDLPKMGFIRDEPTKNMV